jgi:carbamoylphosphate synthase large subunit
MYVLSPRSPTSPSTNYHTQDTPYISPIVAELEAEVTERQDLEAMVINKPTIKK